MQLSSTSHYEVRFSISSSVIAILAWLCLLVSKSTLQANYDDVCNGILEEACDRLVSTDSTYIRNGVECEFNVHDTCERDEGVICDSQTEILASCGITPVSIVGTVAYMVMHLLTIISLHPVKTSATWLMTLADALLVGAFGLLSWTADWPHRDGPVPAFAIISLIAMSVTPVILVVFLVTTKAPRLLWFMGLFRAAALGMAVGGACSLSFLVVGSAVGSVDWGRTYEEASLGGLLAVGLQVLAQLVRHRENGACSLCTFDRLAVSSEASKHRVATTTELVNTPYVVPEQPDLEDPDLDDGAASQYGGSQYGYGVYQGPRSVASSVEDARKKPKAKCLSRSSQQLELVGPVEDIEDDPEMLEDADPLSPVRHLNANPYEMDVDPDGVGKDGDDDGDGERVPTSLRELFRAQVERRRAQRQADGNKKKCRLYF